MRVKKYFIIMILLIGMLSCKTNKIDDYELKTLYEIFDELIERINPKICFLEPPIPPIYDSNHNLIKYDSVEYQRIIDEIEKNNQKIIDSIGVIAVVDSLFTCYNNVDIKYIKSNLTEHGYIEALNAMTDSSIIGRPLDLSKIKNIEGYELRYYSEFPENMEIWKRDNYNFFFLGILGISRIYFDSSRQFGLIYCYTICTRHWGGGTIVCIRKIDDKWTIEEMIDLGVS